jgi:threonine dehydratase
MNSRTKQYLRRIITARVYDVARESALELAPRLSKRIGNTVLLKREDLQPTFSFKLRGAYNKMAGLSPMVLRKGVIAGQGTIGMEILRQHAGPIDAIFVAIGGGGLVSGIAAYVKQVRPEIKIIGVEPIDSDAMYRSLKLGRRVRLPHVGLFADGVAVKEVGKETFRLCRELVDDIIRVDTDEICAAIKDVFEDTRSILEPAGALAIAGLKRHAERRGASKKTFVAVACGANMNFDRLRFVAERAELGEHREAVLAVTIPERPGSFKQFCGLLGGHNITEFNYRYADPKWARVFVGLQVRDLKETTGLIKRLKRAGLEVIDLSHNEMAKLHTRHLVGGRAPEISDERIFRFEFPERPGALMAFLERMSKGWNITLFHYRNHGSDSGRVLAGIQVPFTDRKQFQLFLKNVGYEHTEETSNAAYRLFLS